ncbi:MAG: alcohol dehydrogenase catalytic domain-containing protein [Streptosporangiales bacterium]|nr:alcohol dehydrogenase catalytic domain-containing protein [Streptosporangiales bacterium]
MRAVVYTAPGELELRDVPEPVAGEREVVVDVAYTGICGTDLLVWHGGMTRVQPPVVLGHEFVGRLAAATAELPAGAPVAVEPLLECGDCWACRNGCRHVCRRLRLIGVDVDGGAAARVTVPVDRLHPLPADADLRTFAITEPAAVAVHMVRRAGVAEGEKVAVVGGGPIGALVASVCRARGIADVIVFEPHEDRARLLRGLGLDVVDPTGDDDALTTYVAERAGGEGFDATFEVSGHPAGIAVAPEVTRVRGTVLVGGLFHEAPRVPLPTVTLREQTLVGARVYTPADVRDAIDLLAAGSLPAADLITREVTVEDAIDAGYRHLYGGRSDMKVLIRHPL